MKTIYAVLFLIFSGLLLGQVKKMEYNPGENLKTSKKRVEKILHYDNSIEGATVTTNEVGSKTIDFNIILKRDDIKMSMNVKILFYKKYLTLEVADYKMWVKGEAVNFKTLKDGDQVIADINEEIFLLLKDEFYTE